VISSDRTAKKDAATEWGGAEQINDEEKGPVAAGEGLMRLIYGKEESQRQSSKISSREAREERFLCVGAQFTNEFLS